MAVPHDAIREYEATGSSKAALVRFAMHMCTEKLKAGDPLAMAAIQALPSSVDENVDFNILDMMFVLKLVLLTIGLALQSVGSFDQAKVVEFCNILQSAHGILTNNRPPNKTPRRVLLDRAWNTFKTRTFGKYSAWIHQKPAKPFKLGVEWVHPQTVWRMRAISVSRGAKKADEERIARYWAVKAWAQLTGAEEMCADLACIAAWNPA
jgi:hypothetical protein